MSDGAREDGDPLLRVVAGDPTPEELAALVVVLLARRGSGAPPAAVDAWSDPARAVRAPLLPGPGAWRASALPG